MWKTFKTFLSKFFSHDQLPVEGGLTPDTTSEIVLTYEVDYAAVDVMGEEEVVEIKPKVRTLTDKQLTDNFKLSEFSCNDENKTKVPKEYESNVAKLAKNLQVLRDDIGKPININSAYRTPEYNKKVGGVKTSQHLTAKAADINVKGIGPKRIGEKIKKLIKEGKMDKGGVGIYKNFVHYDIRGVNRSWYGSGVKK